MFKMNHTIVFTEQVFVIYLSKSKNKVCKLKPLVVLDEVLDIMGSQSKNTCLVVCKGRKIEIICAA